MPEEERGRRRRTAATNGPNYLSTLRLGRGSIFVGSSVGKTHPPISAENGLNLVVVDEEQGEKEDENEDLPKETDVESRHFWRKLLL
eukprot:scaffold7470_cov140-Skeletonema_menzelii.AAC.2